MTFCRKEILLKFRRRVEAVERKQRRLAYLKYATNQNYIFEHLRRTEPFSKEEFEEKNKRLDSYFHKKFESYERYVEFFYKKQLELKKWDEQLTKNDEETKA